MRRCLAPCALLLVLPACTAPTVEVVSAELLESTDQGSVVAFTLAAQNAGTDPLPTRFIDYRAQSGAYEFAGVRSGEATLRASGTQLVVVPASFPGRVSVGQPARISGSLGYVLPGPLAQEFFDWGLYRPSVGFAGEAVVQDPAPRPTPIRTTPVLLKPEAPAAPPRPN